MHPNLLIDKNYAVDGLLYSKIVKRSVVVMTMLVLMSSNFYCCLAKPTQIAQEIHAEYASLVQDLRSGRNDLNHGGADMDVLRMLESLGKKERRLATITQHPEIQSDKSDLGKSSFLISCGHQNEI